MHICADFCFYVDVLLGRDLARTSIDTTVIISQKIKNFEEFLRILRHNILKSYTVGLTQLNQNLSKNPPGTCCSSPRGSPAPGWESLL